MNNLKIWQQLTENYTEMMQDTVDHTMKMWQFPVYINGKPTTSQDEAYLDELETPQQNRPEVTSPEPEPSKPKESEDPRVWNYKGYHLEGNNFTNAMVHFFRAEVYRADLWRKRLDTTTNWAVITTAATLSMAWDPRVIILNTLLITLFLYIEARRYRYYELWSYRVRLMETEFFAAMLVPPFRPSPEWAESLAESLHFPKFTISMWEAFGRRLRNNYVWIYTILWMAWLLSNWIHPTPAESWIEFTNRASVGTVPGWFMLLVGVIFNSILVMLGVATMRFQEAPSEVAPYNGSSTLLSGLSYQQNGNASSDTPNQKGRKQIMAIIITDRSKAVSDRILNDMGRGVTSMSGMHTGNERNVLLCALTTTEMTRLKTTVSMEDPHAMVISLPASEVAGANFTPLS